MYDNFKGGSFNPFKSQLDELRDNMPNPFPSNTIANRIDISEVYKQMHSMLNILEAMGKKIGELSSEIHEIKNRSSSE